MVSVERNMYVLKQRNGTIWNFLYDDKFGIIYKIFKEDIWSNYSILTKKTTGKFSVVLLPNDNICLVYEDLDGSLIMNLYDHTKWNHFNLIKNDNKEKIDIYFKTIFFKNDLFLFYSIHNKSTNIITIVSEMVDERGNLTSETLIDQFNFEHNIPFYIYASNENILYITYQKQEPNYLLGYKLLDSYSKNWSKYYIIDDSTYLFQEYSLLSFEEKIHFLYIKRDYNNIYSLTHCEGKLSSYKYTNIFRDRDISSSALFIIGEHIWCLWISNNELYSIVSIDGGNVFSSPPQFESIEYSSISKTTYISNFFENKRDFCTGEAFFISDDSPKFLLIDNIYRIVNKSNKNSSYLFYFQHYIYALNKKDKHYKNDISERDILIENLYNRIKEQENKLISYENKFKSVNSSILSFNENKIQLNKGIKFLQDSLIDKEKRLNELESIYVEKEKELELLKEDLNNVKIQEINSFDLKKIFDKFSSIFKN